MKKYFIPNVHNQYKPHVLRKVSLGILASITVFVFFVGVLNVELIRRTDLLGAVVIRTLIALTNTNRNQNALPQLKTSPLLEKAAQEKANDMAAKGYFAHTSPDGKAPWYWIKNAGYSYVYAGENLAINFTDSDTAHTAWMNSPTHRANILNGKFTEIGIATANGVYKGRDTVFVVQMFGKPAPTIAATQAEPVKKKTILTPPTVPTVAVSPAVLGAEAETFTVAPEQVEAESQPAEIVSDFTPPNTELVQDVSFAEEALGSPKKTVLWLYVGLAMFILVSLILAICIEIRRQHPKNVLAGSALLLLIVSLLYIYQNVLFGQVFVL